MDTSRGTNAASDGGAGLEHRDPGLETAPARYWSLVSRPTWEVLRELAQFHSEGTGAISFYANLEPSSSPTPQADATRFNSLLTEADSRYAENGDGAESRGAVRAGLQRIREWCEDEFDRDGIR